MIGRNDAALGIGLLAALVVGAWLDAHGPAAAPPPNAFASDETASEGYAAFARLLAREQVRVAAVDTRPGLLADDVDTVIEAYAPREDAPLTPSVRASADLDDLHDWVERGGRAIVIGVDARVAPLERRVLGRPLVVEARRAGAPYRGPLGHGLHDLAFAGAVRFAARNMRTLLADAGGALVVDVPLGRGRIWYVADGRFLTNANIGRGDNAVVALALGTPQHPGGHVVFDESLHGHIVDPSIWSIMPMWLRVGVCDAALIAVLALAGSALRLGPPVPERASEPTSAAFLAAVTTLYERAGVLPENG